MTGPFAVAGTPAARVLVYCARVCETADVLEAADGALEAAAREPEDEPFDVALLRCTRRSALLRAGRGSRSARSGLIRLTAGSDAVCDQVPTLLAARANGELLPSDLERLETHLGRCPDCRGLARRVDDAERLWSDLATRAREAREAERRRSRPPRRPKQRRPAPDPRDSPWRPPGIDDADEPDRPPAAGTDRWSQAHRAAVEADGEAQGEA